MIPSSPTSVSEDLHCQFLFFFFFCWQIGREFAKLSLLSFHLNVFVRSEGVIALYRCCCAHPKILKSVPFFSKNGNATLQQIIKKKRQKNSDNFAYRQRKNFQKKTKKTKSQLLTEDP